MTEMDQNLNNVSGEETVDANTAYVDAIKELRETTVSKEQYQKLMAERNQLITALKNGETIQEANDKPVDVEALRKKLFTKDLSNLEYVDTALQLRKELIARGERDPFLPVGEKVRETSDMHIKAQEIAEGLQYCVDSADGDSGVFTAYYQKLVKDPIIPRRSRR